MKWEEIAAKIGVQGGYMPCLHPKAFDELEELFRRDRPIGEMVTAAIIKICKNPLPRDMRGIGQRLGKRKETGDLKPLLYVKIVDTGIRIVYALTHTVDKKDKAKISRGVTIVVINK